jgi:hypothetical protein
VEATDGYARENVEKRKYGIEDSAADIFEVDVDPLRARILQLDCEIGIAVIEAIIKAEFSLNMVAFSFPPAMPTARAPLIFASWPTAEPTEVGFETGSMDADRCAGVGLESQHPDYEPLGVAIGDR